MLFSMLTSGAPLAMAPRHVQWMIWIARTLDAETVAALPLTLEDRMALETLRRGVSSVAGRLTAASEGEVPQ